MQKFTKVILESKILRNRLHVPVADYCIQISVNKMEVQ